MCGIAGFSLAPGETVDAQVIAKAMLLAIEHRGKDATGLAFCVPDPEPGAPNILYNKDAVPAADFVKKGLTALDSGARTVILHTRYATQGDPKDNRNNHPIIRSRQGLGKTHVVGVHNGCLVNDFSLMRAAERTRVGEVDSQAIFALLADDGPSCLSKITGTMAIAWLDSLTPDALYLARGHGSPLWVGKSEKGSLFFASTQGAINNACSAARLGKPIHVHELREGDRRIVRDGTVTLYGTFTPSVPSYSSAYYGVDRGHWDKALQRYVWDSDDDYGEDYWDKVAERVEHAGAARAPGAGDPSATDDEAQEDADVLADEALERYLQWQAIYDGEADVNFLLDELSAWEGGVDHVLDEHVPGPGGDFEMPCAQCAKHYGSPTPAALIAEAREARDVLLEMLDYLVRDGANRDAVDEAIADEDHDHIAPDDGGECAVCVTDALAVIGVALDDVEAHEDEAPCRGEAIALGLVAGT